MKYEEVKLKILCALITQVDLHDYIEMNGDQVAEVMFKKILKVADFMTKEFIKDNE